ncbi:hypothetical protein T265_02279 [Opisthorchis viverrini]|uniref:Uncharacterized protein n=1 Tax=Opisthorchis viverrini TaxID=6198 RepID=A0A074ZWK6_OPIVI|nr:hypothetical protein T265_02279 [Opisthorchis viverrini]KER31511.1 hypothetical protein T265_02279 [Opisthorchis viverrini]
MDGTATFNVPTIRSHQLRPNGTKKENGSSSIRLESGHCECPLTGNSTMGLGNQEERKPENQE